MGDLGRQLIEVAQGHKLDNILQLVAGLNLILQLVTARAASNASRSERRIWIWNFVFSIKMMF